MPQTRKGLNLKQMEMDFFVESKISFLNCFDSHSGLAHVKMHKNSEKVKVTRITFKLIGPTHVTMHRNSEMVKVTGKTFKLSGLAHVKVHHREK